MCCSVVIRGSLFRAQSLLYWEGQSPLGSERLSDLPQTNKPLVHVIAKLDDDPNQVPGSGGRDLHLAGGTHYHERFSSDCLSLWPDNAEIVFLETSGAGGFLQDRGQFLKEAHRPA